MGALVDSNSTLPSTSSSTFEEQTLEVLMRLRGAVAQAMSVLPGGIQKSQDIQKRFGLSFTISWQIYRMMRAQNILESVPHIPTPRLMEKFVTTIAKDGVAPEAVAAVKAAFNDFEEHVKSTSGDRATFEAMATRMNGGATDADVDFTHRRSLFDSHRYVIGVEQDLFVGTLIMHPGEEGLPYIDTINLRIRQNLRRLRSGVSLKVDMSLVVRNPEAGSQPLRHPLDEEAFKKNGNYILPEFCSQADPPLVQKLNAQGILVTKWIPDAIGKSSAIDLAVGTYTRSISMLPKELTSHGHHLITSILTPTRKYIYDVIIPKSAMGPVEFDITNWGYAMDLPGAIDMEDTDIPQLPCSDRISLVGEIGDGCIPELPQYGKMIKKYCTNFGWKPEDMRLYRMRTEYPLMHVMQRIICRFPSVPT